MTIAEWEQKGTYAEILGMRVFYYDSDSMKPPLVILHGYPTCSWDYVKVLPMLERHFRVIVHDHPGFGLSDKPSDYSYSLIDQTDVALLLWQKLNLTRAQVLAHDYGTSIATELIARHHRELLPMDLTGVLLANGSMHIELSQLRPIQKLLMHKRWGPTVAKLASFSTFQRNMRKIGYRPDYLTMEELESLWQLLIAKGGREALPKLTQYIRERSQFWHRWIGSLQQTQLPIQILWATEDPVAVAKMATVLHDEIPHSQLKLLDQLGHYPMLEDPDRWGRAALEMMLAPTPNLS
ncbi:alpha/beta hydrolase [Pontibacter sp. G13]|uniref:alpha/beta fold hydrolase n=1 Tax=Pontibacter sp. G13 TaxID=3074898 RepID=UPI00288AF86D|nr:alpha/beta hydrolase [Pontibacter sp. G13]WNJ18484.1 alpha/beta hydrolase [Pontibacter sp. G13]